MDKEGLNPQTLRGGGGAWKGPAALQDMSRPTFGRSALENIEDSVVLLLASWQPYVERAYPDLKHTPACSSRERNKRGRRNRKTMRKAKILLLIKETQHYLKGLFKLLDPTKLYTG